MTSTPKSYSTDGEVAALVADLLAADNELRIEVGDEVYTLKIANADTASPSADDVERSLSGIERAAGSWSDEDAESFLDYVYRRRSMPPRPAVKL